MDPLYVALIAAAVALVTAILTALIVRARIGSSLARAEAQVEASGQEASRMRTERDAERARAEQLAREVADAKTLAVAANDRVQWVEQAEQKLRDTFQALASSTLRQSTEALISQSKEQLGHFSQVLRSDWGTQTEQMKGLLEPLKVGLTRLDEQVATLEQKREGAYSGLREQIGQLTKQQVELQRATTNLDAALRNSSQRGKWGELQLRRLVEMAGLLDHVDFEEQSHQGDVGRPDMIVHLPQGGILPVDAKAPMSAYLSSQEADNADLQRTELIRHARQVKGHVDTLAGKAYWSAFDRAAEFVVMVVPYESALGAAFGVDPQLLEYALNKRVLIASPVSFLALLRVVGYGWLQLQLSENAERIAEHGRELLNRLPPFVQKFNEVGKALSRASEAYNGAAGSFERRILPTARRLQELGASGDAPEEAKTIDPPQPRQLSLGD